MDPLVLSGVGSVLSGLGGLFGKKKKDPTPAQNILSQAQGVREAAEQYGFNPLTLLQYGQPGGALAGSGGPPPLASIQLLADGLGQLTPEAQADAKRQREADQLNLDLAKLKLEQARSGVIVAPQSAVHSPERPAVLGKTALAVYPGQSALTSVPRPLPRPTMESAGSIPVFNLSGGEMPLNKRIADQLNLKPWDVITGDQAEEIFGEVGGNVATLPHQLNAPETVFGGLGDPFSKDGRDDGLLSRLWSWHNRPRTKVKKAN